jgi:hypothetical protein
VGVNLKLTDAERGADELLDAITTALAEDGSAGGGPDGGAGVADPGPRTADPTGERDSRLAALRRVRAALAARGIVTDAAEDFVGAEVTRAVWLGASLADLAAITGHTRQAARKRWPELGGVYRRRRWLGDHASDVLHVARLVLDAGPEPSPDGASGAFDAALDRLRAAVAAAESAFDTPPDGPEDAAARWRAFDALVDGALRDVVRLAAPAGHDAADRALAGASATITYYDIAVGGTP